MKRMIFGLLVLTAATMQANDLAESWNKLGEKHRPVSFVKAVIVGILAYEAGRAGIDAVGDASTVFNNGVVWKSKWEEFARALVVAGGMGYTTFNLGYYFLPKHTKHAFAID